MIKMICDRCGKTIDADQYVGYIAWNFRDKASGDLTDENIFENCDYCEECMNEINKFIQRDPADLAAGPSDLAPMAAGQTDEKTGKRNSQIDMGKVKALRDAGWSIGRIAEEMSVSPEEIAQEVYSTKKQERRSAKT